MSQIKELDYNEKLVTILAIIAGLIIFALTLFKCNGGAEILGVHTEDTSDIASENITQGLIDENVALKNQMEKNLAEYDASLAEIEARNKTIAERNITIAKLENEAKKKSSLATVTPITAAEESYNKELNALSVKYKALNEDYLKLKNKQSTATKLVELKRLEAENTTLKKRYDDLIIEKSNISADAEKSKKELHAKIKSLSSGSDESEIKATLAKADKQWKNQINQLKVHHGQELAKLRKGHNTQLNKYRNLIRSTKAKKVFADSTADLAPAGGKLIDSLEGYEGNTGADLSKLYSQNSNKVKARRKLIVNFASGSDTVSDDDSTKIQNLISNSDNNSYFVAVGYADSSGSAADNKSLSSRRATNTAKVIQPNLNKTQFTQAYYLGQTSRFGADENNRIVEIWEITE